MQELYENGTSDQIIIINEFDQLINEWSYHVYNNQLHGLWQLKGKKVFAFSATSSQSHERLIANCIEMPHMLKFLSEYEMVMGSSPNVDPGVVILNEERALFE